MGSFPARGSSRLTGACGAAKPTASAFQHGTWVPFLSRFGQIPCRPASSRLSGRTITLAGAATGERLHIVPP
jgi:hypothetical protein